jgi:hypothetical protein
MNAEYHLTVEPGMCTVVSYMVSRRHITEGSRDTTRQTHGVRECVGVGAISNTRFRQPIVVIKVQSANHLAPLDGTFYGVLVGHTALEDEATAAASTHK